MYLSLQQVATHLAVSEKTVFRYIKSGQLKARKIGRWKIKPRDLTEFENKHLAKRIGTAKLKPMKPQYKTAMKIPLFASAVAAGFPSPADDFIEDQLDLNRYLITNKVATFFLRAQGDSMINAGIHSGDILIVDRSQEAKNDSVVIAAINGEFTVKRFKKVGKKIQLLPENNNLKPIDVSPDDEFTVWGVVTNVIHQL